MLDHRLRIPGAPTDAQVVAYIAEQAAELRKMAESRQLRMIAYLLDMARLEAERGVKGMRQGRPCVTVDRRKGDDVLA